MKPINYMVLVLVFAFFSDCKKYPENTLWFKSPNALVPFEGKIKKYAVNGIDSLDLLDSYFGNLAVGLNMSIRTAEFKYTNDGQGDTRNFLYFGSSLLTPIWHELVNKKKFMKIGIAVDTAIYKKNLFISRDVEWKIMRLAKKGRFKIETTLENGNHYEIEIE